MSACIVRVEGYNKVWSVRLCIFSSSIDLRQVQGSKFSLQSQRCYLTSTWPTRPRIRRLSRVRTRSDLLKRLGRTHLWAMSLYHEAASVIDADASVGGNLRSRVFNNKDLKSPPGQIYALALETCKWSSILSEVIDNSQLLQHEKRVSNQPRFSLNTRLTVMHSSRLSWHSFSYMTSC